VCGGTVDADGVEQERSDLRVRQALSYQLGGELAQGGAERAWHRPETKGRHLVAGKVVKLAPLMGKGDQLIRWAGSDSVFRQQPQKLFVLRVSMGDRSCNEYSCDDGGKPSERVDEHG
jgi:hypothetical protein